MDFSAANTALWNTVIQFGIIAVGVLFCNILRRKISFIKKALAPTAVLTGFLFLILRSTGLLELDTDFLGMVTYHGIAIGFIALSLRVPKSDLRSEKLLGAKSGALIVSTYLIQALTGLLVSVVLAFTLLPDLFMSSGILLPMGYGQGAGQANNIGSSLETLGFTGGRSFGLSLAAAGYLCACTVGVIYLNILHKKGTYKRQYYEEVSGSLTIDDFQDKDEIAVSESIDKFSIQGALILLVYLGTYLLTFGITSLLEAVAPGVADMVASLLWGFNFIIGSMLALLVRSILSFGSRKKLIRHQYQNNYLLNRISGLAFDVMIIAGITSINIEELSGLWLPFILMSVLGGAVTFVYLRVLCRKLYPDYYDEGFVSMYGMLTGTISSGVLLLRELDPALEKPAVSNLVSGSSYGIIFGAPILVVTGLISKSNTLFIISVGIVIVYLILLLVFILKVKPKKK